MVQLQNPDRFNQNGKIVKFGTAVKKRDANGFPTYQFEAIGGPTLCGGWGLTTSQMIQQKGLQDTDSFIIVVHHRNNWDKITHAWLNNQLYEVTNKAIDPFNNPTAYDRLTLTKVSDIDG